MMSAGMATLMAPASGMIVSSLPLSKSGVGSAVNDVTREVGGALGIAIMGSVLASGYGSKMADKIAGLPIPAQFADLIKDSIGPAFGVAKEAQARGMIDADRAQFLREAAKESFVNGSRIAFFVAAGVAVIGALVAGNLIPNETPEHGSVLDPAAAPVA
jgi:hypothetical protein